MPLRHLSPEECLQLCRDGNQRYVSGDLSFRHLSELRTSLVGGQSPHAAVLSCADSRVPVEMIFDQGPGDLFVIRSAGNTPFSEAIASLEYALQFLNTPLIVVMGHSHCGAVAAALNQVALPDQAAHLSYLVGKIHVGSCETGQLEKAIWNNARHTVAKLTEESGIIRAFVQERRARILPAVYDIESGHVAFDAFPAATHPMSAHPTHETEASS